jgi:hypothetical protein
MDPAAEPDHGSNRPGGIGDVRRFWFRVIAVIGGVSITALGAECVVRVANLGPVVYEPRRFEPGGVPFTRLRNGAVEIPVYRPNATFSSVYDPLGDARGYLGPDGRVDYRINGLGFRGEEVAVAKPPGTRRIICLGDSFTFGEGVHEPDTFPRKLEARLRAESPDDKVEVINAGVQAYGTREEGALFSLRCQPLNPDGVVLAMFLNDATDFGETVRQHEARTHRFAPEGLARYSRILEIFQRGQRSRRQRDEYFATTRASFDSQNWKVNRDLLLTMKTQADRGGFTFVVLLFPMLTGLDGHYPFEDLHDKIAATCHDIGCPLIDLLEVYRGRPDESLWVHPTDQHPNEIAHALAADALAGYFKGAPRPSPHERTVPDL